MLIKTLFWCLIINCNLGFAAASRDDSKASLRAKLAELRAARTGRPKGLELARGVRSGKAIDIRPELFEQKTCIVNGCRCLGSPACMKHPVFFLCLKHACSAVCYECRTAKK